MILRTLRRVLGREAEGSKDVVGWSGILRNDPDRWAEAKAAADGPHVLIATGTGGQDAALMVESSLAVALTLRGARVHFLLCDGALPACLMCHYNRFGGEERFLREGPQARLCESCFGQGLAAYEPLGLPLHRYGDLLTPAERKESARVAASVPVPEMADFRWDGLAVGEHALAGALRFVTRGDIEGQPNGEAVAQRYLEAGLLTARALGRLLERHPFEHAVFHHGIYVPQGIVGEATRRRGVHVVNWQTSYRERCYTFSHDRSYHFTMLDEPETTWSGMAWGAAQETEIVEYLDSRRHGTRDWISYHERPVEDLGEIESELGVDFSRPCVALLTNVVWDAVLHYRDNAFSGGVEWTLETIRWFAGRPDLQLVIRVHPAEVRGTLRSRQPILEEIRREFPELPPNVFIVPPESRIGTYALADACDAAIIYGTKTGIELAAAGVPVIVAGEAWVRNKGFTLDASSAEEYFRILERLPLGERMSDDDVRRARQYAYHFFYRRMIPWGFMEPTGGSPPFRLAVQRIDELLPGRDRGLDVVCDGILGGAEFVYPAELAATEALASARAS